MCTYGAVTEREAELQEAAWPNRSSVGLDEAVGYTTMLLDAALFTLGSKKSWETPMGVSARRKSSGAAFCPPGDCSLLSHLRSLVVNLIPNLWDFDSQWKRGVAARMGFLVWEPLRWCTMKNIRRPSWVSAPERPRWSQLMMGRR